MSQIISHSTHQVVRLESVLTVVPPNDKGIWDWFTVSGYMGKHSNNVSSHIQKVKYSQVNWK